MKEPLMCDFCAIHEVKKEGDICDECQEETEDREQFILDIENGLV